MAKHPARRFASAAAVARALQQVEADLRLPITPLDLMDAPGADPDVPAPVGRRGPGGRDPAALDRHRRPDGTRRARLPRRRRVRTSRPACAG